MKRLIYSAIFLCVAILVANANEAVDSIAVKSHVNVIIGSKENEQDVENAFKENIPQDKSVAGMPHFAIVGKYKRFYLGIGANFKASASFDFGDEMPSELDFVPSQITPSTPGNGAITRFTAQSSAIYLNFIAMPNNPNKTGLFFSGNFKGENYRFKMSHFYIKYRGLKFGYTHSAFTDNNAVPFTIDDQGPAGEASMKTVVAMWTQPITKNIDFTIGIDAPKVSIEDTTAYTHIVNQRIPAIPLWLQYKSNDNYIRASAILRTLQYRDLVQQQNRNVAGWGVQLSGLYELTHNIKLLGSANYGQGIANYVQDISDLNLDLLPDTDHAGKMYGTPSWAVTLGAELNFSDKFSSNLLYSRMNLCYKDIAGLDTNMVKHTQYVTANFIYNITYFIKLGIEYQWGYRKSIDGKSNHVNRLQCLFAVEI